MFRGSVLTGARACVFACDVMCLFGDIALAGSWHLFHACGSVGPFAHAAVTVAKNKYRGVPQFWTHSKYIYVFCDLSVREKDWRGKPGL
jgi:hypothetical protein